MGALWAFAEPYGSFRVHSGGPTEGVPALSMALRRPYLGPGMVLGGGPGGFRAHGRGWMALKGPEIL